MLWRMSAEPHLDRIGIMLARLDNLPQRHRSVTLHAAAREVDFRTSVRWERIPGRHDRSLPNSPSPPCHAKPPAIGISLAEIAGITRSWQRPARAGPRDWHNACGNCGNPRHGPPVRYRDRIEGGAERAERSETRFSGPIAVRKYSWGARWVEKWHDRCPARQLVGSLAGQRELADVGSMVPTYSGRPWRSPASNQKIPNRFNAGKPQTPGNVAYLFRPSASQSSDRDAQVGMFEIEGLARRHARQLHPAHERDGETDGATTHSPHPEERPQAASRRMGNITTGPILRDAALSLPRGYSRGAAPQDEAGLRQPIDLPRRAAEQCRLIGPGRARRHQLEGVPQHRVAGRQ